MLVDVRGSGAVDKARNLGPSSLRAVKHGAHSNTSEVVELMYQLVKGIELTLALC
jgi:hypothetical protein